MNRRFTRPGVVCSKKDEPFYFLKLAPHGAIDRVQPRVCQLDDEPALAEAYRGWQTSRNDFNQRLRAGGDAAVREAWQRSYVRSAGADAATPFHVSKRKLKAPR